MPNFWTPDNTVKKIRCNFCNRRIFNTDFQRGNATVTFELFDTLKGVGDREVYSHTYDCENIGRKVT